MKRPTVTAALMRQTNHPLELTELELEAPRRGEVEVEIGASGICHSDLSVLKGALTNPLPAVLGHEGAGTVVALGEGVEGVAEGDRVTLSWMAQCGHCFYCQRLQPVLCTEGMSGMLRGTLPDGSTRFRLDGQPVYHMAGLGTFSQRVVVPVEAIVPIPRDFPMAQAALLGCGVLTGFGAAANTARIQPGESVAVVGCGGVGLNAIQGARISGATVIIAIDPRQERLDLARALGATATFRPEQDPVRRVRELTGGRGADAVLEVAGLPQTISDAVRMARPGGRVVIVSAPAKSVTLDVPVFTGMVMTEKTIRGSLYGSSTVRRDIPRLVSLYESRELRLDELVTATFSLDRINDALAYCAAEQGARAVIVF